MQRYDDEDNWEDLYLTFLTGDDAFGIDIRYVKEIIGVLPITVIPEMPEHIKGVVNLRGRIIPVMDVRLRFKKSSKGYDSRTCIVVVDIHGSSIGLIVDRVDEVVSIPESEIAPPPEIGKQETGYIKGFGKINGEIKLLLECEALLKNDVRLLQKGKGNGQ